VRVVRVEDDIDLSGSTIVVGVLDGLEPISDQDRELEDIDHRTLEVADFEGKKEQTIVLPHDHADALLLVGVGDEASFESLRSAAGAAIRSVKTSRVVTRLGAADVDGASRAVVEGVVLGGYKFLSYKQTADEETREVELVELVGADENEIETSLIVAEATNLARDWVNTPARDKSPETLAGLQETAAISAGMSVEVWERDRIEVEGLGGLLGVAAGSDREPRVVVLTYEPDHPSSHLALVGKGITFDSGGLSIKSAASMMEMKDDMSGAAITAAAAIAIARLGLGIKVTCIVPMTDNAIGGDATRPGDVLRPLEGPTIEVLNTDAEGRLILADGLGLARRADPDLIVDVATLTGAARVALGDRIAAVFGSDSDTASLILDAAARAGEEFWELPLFENYRQSIDSEIADIKNVSSSRYGGAIIAALFLAEYSGDGPWAHLDVAGPARSREVSGEIVKGASGVGVRTLVELARHLADQA
jgi:leucyl aminopeptidase